MKIGVPKEIKNNENRVAVTPGGAKEIVKAGHTLLIQAGAGVDSGFSDEEYVKAGATIVPTIKDVYEQADMIYKVKEPIPEEYPLIKEGQVLFAYFHFAAEEELTKVCMEKKTTCIAFETIRGPDGRSLPCLIPMSEVAGRMSVQQGAHFLEMPRKGKGILMGGVPGVKPAKVLVLGCGTVGYYAAITAAGMGADVTVTDVWLPRLRQIEDFKPHNIHTLFSNQYNIEQELPTADVIIGSALVPGAATPHLVTKEMEKLIRPGTVLVDVAIDQGGCFESSHPTTHSDPIWVDERGLVHYCVANIPGAVPMTSTPALANATLPYCLKLAKDGWEAACRADKGLAQGLNIVKGEVVIKGVADKWNLPLAKWE